MGWVKDGEFIKALYYGQEISGTVESSRVKYGGQVQYTVTLDVPVQMPWRREPTHRVLIDESELIG